jgi:hypothetical protein
VPGAAPLGTGGVATAGAVPVAAAAALADGAPEADAAGFAALAAEGAADAAGFADPVVVAGWATASAVIPKAIPITPSRRTTLFTRYLVACPSKANQKKLTEARALAVYGAQQDLATGMARCGKTSLPQIDAGGLVSRRFDPLKPKRRHFWLNWTGSLLPALLPPNSPWLSGAPQIFLPGGPSHFGTNGF